MTTSWIIWTALMNVPVTGICWRSGHILQLSETAILKTAVFIVTGQPLHSRFQGHVISPLPRGNPPIRNIPQNVDRKLSISPELDVLMIARQDFYDYLYMCLSVCTWMTSSVLFLWDTTDGWWIRKEAKWLNLLYWIWFRCRISLTSFWSLTHLPIMLRSVHYNIIIWSPL